MIYRDSGQVTVLYSKHMILYTWDEPLGVRKLFWKPYTGVDKPVEVLADKVYILYMLHQIYNNLWLIFLSFSLCSYQSSSRSGVYSLEINL